MNPPVLDTHALLWWTLDPEMLSARAGEICADIGRTGALVSSISIWEIGVKIKRGKLEIGLSIEAYLERLSRLDSLKILPVDGRTWVANLDLDWDHNDLADRTIVATALIHDTDLITKDEMIRQFYARSVW